MRKIKLGKSKIIIGLAALFMTKIMAAPPPISPKSIGSIQPGVISSQIKSQTTEENKPENLTPASKPKSQEAGPLGAQAAKIKFKLVNIILEGNTVYSSAEIRKLYKDKLNTTISVAQLQDIVQSITNYYRNNGYILTRAVIPPQHVAGGVVRVRVVEGYIDKAVAIGHPRGAKKLVEAYGNKIVQNRPTQIKVMERYLILENEIPGVEVKGILEPSKTQVGASDLNLATETKNFGAFFSYDDYGTRYVGPQQMTGGVQANSIFRDGDTTSFTYVGTPKGNELQYKDLMHETPIGSSGLRFAFDANQAITNPLYALADLQIAGNAKDYNGTLRYPLIRTRSSSMTIAGTFNYLDSYTTELDTPLYTDHIRSVKLGGTYDFADRFKGSNSLGLDFTRGLPNMGGTSDNQSLFTSRYGATSKFTKIMGRVSRLQQLFWRFSLYGQFKGQYSFEPLLASEQFAFGGSQLGRGYDPAEIIGDRGVGGSVELRLDAMPQRFLIQSLQFYTFYDAGKVWNLRNVQSTSTSQDATSTGVGIRFSMTKFISGNFMLTQPLSKKVQALQLIGNGSRPRGFFSITAVV